MTTKTYDPSKIAISLDGKPITGFAAGTVIVPSRFPAYVDIAMVALLGTITFEKAGKVKYGRGGRRGRKQRSLKTHRSLDALLRGYAMEASRIRDAVLYWTNAE